MGRIARTGLDYFSVDTTWETNMRLVKAKFGLRGIGFMVELYASIYHDGYYRKWDEENELLFADEIREDISWVREIIQYCFKQNLLDEDIFNGHGVLTSHGIQKRYFKTTSDLKRTNIDFVDGIAYAEFIENNIPGGKADIPGGKADIPGGKADIPGGYDHKQSRAEGTKANLKKAGKHNILKPATDPEPACLQFDIQELEDRIKSAPFTSSFSSTDYEAFAARLSALSLDLGFVDYCIDRIARDKKTSKPAGLLKAGILKYDDWHKEYRDSMPSPSEPLAPEIEQCECGAQPRCSRRLGEAVCTCGRSWTYDRDFKYWVLDPVENVG